MNTKLLSWVPKALFIALMVLLITLFGSQTARAAGMCYVKASAVGANTGASWASAYTDLQSALGASPCTEVWVAAGTYKPIPGTDRNISFTLKNGVALYGGFAGTETLRSQRNPAANPTILSGDLGTLGNATDNSYHVVVGGGTNATAVLDGFTATGGYATDFKESGGGMYNVNSSPTLANLTFNSNTAIYGGGMYNDNNSSPTLTNVTFSGNLAFVISGGGIGGDYGGDGGGMYNHSGSNPTLTNVTFSGNSALYGGSGMYNTNSSPTLTNATFSGNFGIGISNWSSNPILTNVTFSNSSNYGMDNYYSSPILTNVTFSGNSGCGMSNGYSSNPTLMNVTFSNNSGCGMFNLNSSPTLTNVTFSGNSGSYGGGMYNGNSSPTLTNVTFSGNSALYGGGGMYNYMSNPQIRNSIFWGNSASTAGAEIYNDTSSPSLADSVVAGGCPSGATCANILTTNPLLGPLGNNGGFTQTMALSAGSSAIDTGNDATCASTDQRGVARPQGAHCDMGAYEWVDYAYWIYLPLVIR